ncbi:MAG: cobalamin-binding protein [Salinicola sp.]|uniref:cobalamin-binding protein n=1 Tax=Salinicola sp. TaxID=1978524 RepID=UPI001DC7F8A3|nr:cobalamin-binding protein [Salinicola sp.]NRB56529.1 cobalamin-binding protein [Salinicola sp.]
MMRSLSPLLDAVMSQVPWRPVIAAVGAALLPLHAMAEVDAISVEDDSGRTVTLSRPAERIVALAPHLVEMSYAVDAGGQLVGAIEGSDYPPAAAHIDRVGSYRGVPIELVVAKRPDLVLVWGSGTPASLIEQLERLEIPVYRSEPRKLDQIADDLRDIGRLSGHDVAGEKAASRFERALQRSSQTLSPEPRVFYQLGQSPLTTLAGGQVVTQIIRHCGGEPLFEEAPVLVPQIGWESLLEAQPEVILAAGADDRWKAFWAHHDELPAVRDGALYTVDRDAISRPGPRMIQAVQEVCQALAEVHRTSIRGWESPQLRTTDSSDP